MFISLQYACGKSGFDVFNEVQEGNASRRSRVEFCLHVATVIKIVIENLMYKEVKHAQCIPIILDGSYQSQEIRQCFDLLIRETPPFIQSLVRELKDTTGKGMVAVPLCDDGTYFYFEEMNIKL